MNPIVNPIMAGLMRVDTLTDQVIAMDFLISTKTAIKLYAVAATESATPDLRTTFERHLFEAIELHGAATAYAMQKGYYHPYNVSEQLLLDQRNVQMAVSLPS
ncbi:MAG: spore coat protein [Firmicutes bacterium]|nr:spore coat protein [Bacillota bacterium]